MLVLSSSDVDGLLDWSDTIEICEKVFRWIGSGDVVQAHINPLDYRSEGGGESFALPFLAFVKPLGVFGNKWGGGSENNRARGLRSFNATIILNDIDSGREIAVLDGGLITSLRTGAHAALGAKYLARVDSQKIAVIGCGAEGTSFLHAMNALFQLTDVRAVSKTRDSAEKFARENASATGLPIRVYDDPRQAVAGADIICMCTTSKTSILDEAWIEPGTHVAATQAFTDIDPRFSSSADKWVLGNLDSDSAWLGAPPFNHIEGLTLNSVFGDMVEIISGAKPGRERNDERTVMTHMGMGALDIAVAHKAFLAAKEAGIGTTIDLH